MSSIVKATLTLNIESDIVNKEAGEIVKTAVNRLLDPLVAYIEQEIAPVEEKKEAEKK